MATPTRGLEGKLYDASVYVCGRKVEHCKDVFPARLDAGGLYIDHLSHAAHYHVPDGDRPGREGGREGGRERGGREGGGRGEGGR